MGEMFRHNNRRSRMTLQLVNLIRKDWKSGKYTLRELEQKYSIKSLNKIVTNQTYTDPAYVPPKRNSGVLGERNNQSKLDSAKVRKIRELHQKGVQIQELAVMYQVSRLTISNIVNGKNWKHVHSTKIDYPEPGKKVEENCSGAKEGEVVVEATEGTDPPVISQDNVEDGSFEVYPYGDDDSPTVSIPFDGGENVVETKPLKVAVSDGAAPHQSSNDLMERFRQLTGK